MNQTLPGKRISAFEVKQPKCLNIPEDLFRSRITGAQIETVSYRGKWLLTQTSQGWILLNLGMGGEILLTDRQNLPPKYRAIIDFWDGSALVINFWWFGYLHYAEMDALAQHEMTAKLGPNILDLSEEAFVERLVQQKGKIKAVLLDQSRFAGIGNAYIHDILFLAHLHPLRPVASLSSEETHQLYQAIRHGLFPALAKGGAFYETDLFGNKGRFLAEDILIGYREGQPCPQCQTPIIKIKTGSTSSFICPYCQPETV
jgi:formamidopyrimidine-DNA glycosylase